MSRNQDRQGVRGVDGCHITGAGDVLQHDDNIYETPIVSPNQERSQSNTQSSKKRISKLQIVVIVAIILNFALAISSIVIVSLKGNEISHQHQKLESKHNAIESSIKDARRKLSDNITLVEEREIRNHESYANMLEDARRKLSENITLVEEREIRNHKSFANMLEDLIQVFTENLVLAEERETRHNATHEKSMKERRFKIVNMSIWHRLSNGYFYKVFENKVSYEEAKASCQEKGARLVTEGVRNVTMRAETKRLMKMKCEDVWIGLNDLTTEGTWTWEDGINGSIEWSPNEPNNGGIVIEDEDCGHYHRVADWSVNDGQCHIENMYMCEKTN